MAMYQHMVSLLAQPDLQCVRNYTGEIGDMSSHSYTVITDLFPAAALDFYTRFNLGTLDPGSPTDAELTRRFYNPDRGGAQGDYRVGMQRKIDNIVDCLTRYPGSKRAVLTVPLSEVTSVQVSHQDTAEAKCLRELHFYIEDGALHCTGFMRAQAVIIFPKNIHLIGSLMALIAQRLSVPVGTYTHFVTTLVSGRD